MAQLNVLKNQRKQIWEQIRAIEKWFAEYDNQIKQATRCERLGIEYDAKSGTVAELDALAETKAHELSSLKLQLKSLKEQIKQELRK